MTMHWECKPRKCQTRRQCPDMILDSAKQAKFETVDPGRLENINTYNAYISHAKEIYGKFQHLLGAPAKNSWAKRMEDAVAQWYRNQDDFILLQPMKRLQRMMTKLSSQGYSSQVNEFIYWRSQIGKAVTCGVARQSCCFVRGFLQWHLRLAVVLGCLCSSACERGR